MICLPSSKLRYLVFLSASAQIWYPKQIIKVIKFGWNLISSIFFSYTCAKIIYTDHIYIILSTYKHLVSFNLRKLKIKLARVHESQDDLFGKYVRFSRWFFPNSIKLLSRRLRILNSGSNRPNSLRKYPWSVAYFTTWRPNLMFQRYRHLIGSLR